MIALLAIHNSAVSDAYQRQTYSLQTRNALLMSCCCSWNNFNLEILSRTFAINFYAETANRMFPLKHSVYGIGAAQWNCPL